MTRLFVPIETLCENTQIRETNLISYLKTIRHLHPSCANQICLQDGNGLTLLHIAAQHRSPQFCQLLLQNVDPFDVVTIADGRGRLPFHHACKNGNIETAKYLYGLYPRCINIPAEEGDYPIHLFCKYDHARLGNPLSDKEDEDMIRFLIRHDQGGLTKNTNNTCSLNDGRLPLHCVSRTRSSTAIVKLVLDAYPAAIFLAMPHHVTNNPTVVQFLEDRLQFIPDGNGQLEIHRRLQNYKSTYNNRVEDIQQLMTVNPDSIRTADNDGQIPLHIACKFGHCGHVQCLVQADVLTLQYCDSKGDLPLHHACREGKFDVINCILAYSTHGVSAATAAGELPIQLLLLEGVDRKKRDVKNDFKWVEAIWRLVRANPTVLF